MTLASQPSWFLHPSHHHCLFPLKGDFMFDAIIEFIQAIFEAITSLSSGSSGSSAVTPEPETIPALPIEDTATTTVPLTPLEPSTPIESEVPGQEPLPDAATNAEDPRLN